MPKSKRLSEFYVYVLLDPRMPGNFKYGRWTFKHEPFYVGKGCGHRIEAHFYPSSLKVRSYKANKIRKIIKETGEYPLQTVKKDGLTEDEAFALEIKLIAAIGRGKEGPLTNATSGGDGISGHTKSRRTRKKMSIATIRTWKDPAVAKARTEGRIATTAARTAEDIAASMRTRKKNWDNRSDRAKRRFSEMRSQGQREYYASLTDREKKEFQAKCSEGKRAYWAQLDEEGHKERSEALSQAHSRRSASKKRAINSKIAESVREAHKRESASSRAAKAEKIRNTLKSMPEEQRERLSAGNTLRGRLRQYHLMGTDVHELWKQRIDKCDFSSGHQIDRLYQRLDKELPKLPYARAPRNR